MKALALLLASVVSTQAQQQCRTIQSGQPCVFPFTYQGVSYNGCTYAGNSATPWCGLDARATRYEDCNSNCPIATNCGGGGGNGVSDRNCGGGGGGGAGAQGGGGGWGQCSGSCGGGTGTQDRTINGKVETRSCTTLDRCAGTGTGKICLTTGGPKVGQQCIFPFKHGNQEYHDCTRAGHKEHLLWCSTKVDATGRHIDGQGNFGTCSKPCFYSGATAGTMIGTSQCVTQGGPASGQRCVFPFKYAGKVHNSCDTWRWGGPNQGKRWCSTKTRTNGAHIAKRGNYGLCPNTAACNGGNTGGVNFPNTPSTGGGNNGCNDGADPQTSDRRACGGGGTSGRNPPTTQTPSGGGGGGGGDVQPQVDPQVSDRDIPI